MKLVEFDLYHKDTYFNQNLKIEDFAFVTVLVNTEQIAMCRNIKQLDDKSHLIELHIVGASECLYGKFKEPVSHLKSLQGFLSGGVFYSAPNPSTQTVEFPMKKELVVEGNPQKKDKQK